MDFPVVRNRAGSLVIIYTEQAGGARPIHGAYLARESDANVWIPCTWSKEGIFKDGKATNLDLQEDWEDFKKNKNNNGETPQQEQEAPIQI